MLCSLVFLERTKMNVLSLYDGISCGMAALERSGISVEKYSAYEIDKYAISVSEKNYPQIEHCGNVFEADYTKYKGYDLLIGGSPCTYWSIANSNRETTADGEGFKLFMRYVIALEKSQCRYFLYENNNSIHQNIKNEISARLGVQPIMINSALVSAQQRKRCYWTNIPDVTQPTDKGILIKDILIDGYPVKYNRKDGVIPSDEKALTFCASYWKGLNRNQTQNAVLVPQSYILNDYKGKARTIKAQYANTSISNAVRQDGFGATCVAVPVRIGHIGNGGQGQRIYSVYGKSVTLSANGGGQGAKTGLYKIDLPDGDYIIRKLYPIEAERLQTLPDNYTEGISNTQRYKCIGNGWTVDVIAHILGFIPHI